MDRTTGEHPHSSHSGAFLWLRDIYAGLVARLADRGQTGPSLEEFWEAGELLLPVQQAIGGWLRSFRDDPEQHPLATPSGRIEIFSETIASFAEADCTGHPSWIPADEWRGAELVASHSLQCMANQPAGRLHSQLIGSRLHGPADSG
jgi:biotin/methionine sulfoxide reductase